MIEKIVRLKADTDFLPPQYRDNTDNDMSMIVYLPDTPVIEGEENYQQQLTALQMRRIVRTIIGRSTLLNQINPSATGNDNELRLHTENGIFYAAIDGIVKTVAAYDNPVSGTRTEGGNRVRLPDHTTSGRVDLVFLEIWFEEVMAANAPGTADTTVYKNGMVHGFVDVNNIRVSSYQDLSETTRRIQLRGKIRAVTANSLSEVEAKENPTYSFSDRGGYWAAGNGDLASANVLDTVDGFVYGIPLVRVTRGADAKTYSNITVVAPVTATLQQLASATLRDISQFALEISDLKSLAGQQTTSLATLIEENRVLKSQVSGLNAQLTAANNRVQSLEKSLRDTEKTVWYRNEQVASLTLFRNSTWRTVWSLGVMSFALWPNHTLTIGRVYAHCPIDGTRLRVVLINGTTNVQRTFEWDMTLNETDGRYFSNGPLLVRDNPRLFIPLPEFEGPRGGYIRVYTYFIRSAPAVLPEEAVGGFSANIEFLIREK